MQDLTEAGFGTNFVNQKYFDLMNPDGDWFKAFMKYLYNVCKIPFLSVYAQPEESIPRDIMDDFDQRLTIIVTKLIAILWRNGLHMGPKIGRRLKTDDSGVVPQLPLNVSGNAYLNNL